MDFYKGNIEYNKQTNLLGVIGCSGDENQIIYNKCKEIIILSQNSFTSEDHNMCKTCLSKFIELCATEDLKFADDFNETGFCGFLLHLLTIDDKEYNKLSIKCINNVIRHSSDLADEFLEHELLPLMAGIIQPPINDATSVAIEVVIKLAKIKKDNINVFFEYAPIAMFMEELKQVSEAFPLMKSLSGKKKSGVYKITNQISAYSLLFTEKEDLSIEETSIIIEMASIVIGAEASGSDKMLNALINLSNKELFLVKEFFDNSFNVSVTSLMKVANFDEVIAICDMFICLIDKGWDCDGFPIKDLLDMLDDNNNKSQQSQEAQLKICDVFKRLIETGKEQFVQEIVELNGFLSFAKLVKEDLNENFSGKPEMNCKYSYGRMMAGAELLLEIIKRTPVGEAYVYGQKSVFTALLEIITIPGHYLTVPSYKAFTTILKSYLLHGNEKDFFEMFYNSNGSEVLVNAELEDDDELDAYNEFMENVPEEFL